MKKGVLSIILIALCFTLNAQIKVGGSIGFMGQSSKSTTSGTTNEGPVVTEITLLPDAEFMLSENFSIGGKLGFSYDKSKNDAADTKSTLFMFHISPYARMYFPMGERLSFYGEGGLGFATGTQKLTAGGTTNDGDKITEFQIGVIPGLNYALSEKIELELAVGFLGYQLTSVNDNGNPETVDRINNYGFDIDLSSIHFGLKYEL